MVDQSTHTSERSEGRLDRGDGCSRTFETRRRKKGGKREERRRIESGGSRGGMAYDVKE